jgi:hypothetical protein
MSGQEKCDLLIQVKGLIEVTTWAGLTAKKYENNLKSCTEAAVTCAAIPRV